MPTRAKLDESYFTMTYAEILSWAPNVEGGRATYLHTNKKK
jgi:hypothetical protein